MTPQSSSSQTPHVIGAVPSFTMSRATARGSSATPARDSISASGSMTRSSDNRSLIAHGYETIERSTAGSSVARTSMPAAAKRCASAGSREPSERGAGAVALELDVYADLAVAHEREHVDETWHALTGAEVDSREFVRAERSDEVGAPGYAAEVGVVRADELAFAREVHVDLDKVEPVLGRQLHREQGVLRSERARAAVSDGPRIAHAHREPPPRRSGISGWQAYTR